MQIARMPQSERLRGFLDDNKRVFSCALTLLALLFGSAEPKAAAGRGEEQG